MAQFLRFATVGVKISAIDAAGVYLLPLFLGFHVYVARAVSLSTAILVGYLLNRYFTFGGKLGGDFFRQMAGHFGVHLIGGALNYGVFLLILHLNHAAIDRPLNLTPLPLIALFLGGMAGMTFNFWCSRRFVFKTAKRRGEDWKWSFWGLFIDQLGRHLFWWFRSWTPQAVRTTGMGGRRLVFLLVFFPLFLLLQLSHWLGFLLDEIFFRRYRGQSLENSILITGIPRSGTTFLHRTLSSAESAFTTVRTWEAILAPSATQKWILRKLGQLDRRLGTPVHRILQRIEKNHFHEFNSVHSVGLESPEEDYLFLLPATGCFILSLAFPLSPWLWSLGSIQKNMPAKRRKELLGFYRSCLQRHKLIFGKDRPLLIKNAAFATWIEPLLDLEPDLRVIICIREPVRALASQVSSISAGMELFGTQKAAALIQEHLAAIFDDGFEALESFANESGANCFLLDQGKLAEDPSEVLHNLQKWLPVRTDCLESVISRAIEETKRHKSGHEYVNPVKETTEETIGACQQARYLRMLQQI